MIAVRVVLGALIVLLAAVVVLPAVVLVDLVTGGSGLGLCPDGLGTCETSLFTLLELALVFGALAGGLGFGIAGCWRMLTRHRRRPVS
ncbi:MAG: hypothetical protein R2823_08480 [Acidimicrobiia bacterium]